ncbi:MAG: shikimate dehydrogenase [Bradyrhizobiaceae bacterium]|nr:shikimate dehydrogenase [Bradyrhizobiaceae bacterium]
MRRACIIGHPIAHSRSPVIHRFWLAEHKIDGDYAREDVLPEQLPEFLTNLAQRGYVGGNITVPHKETAYRLLARADATAEALQAVNTIWLENGKLVGMNTDVHGFLANLDEAVPDWQLQPEQAVVFGAGGGARAVVYGLLQRGLKRVVVVNRTPGRAEAIATRFGLRVTIASYDDLPEWLQDADLFVNTTTLGMAGQPPLEIDLAPMQSSGIVCDIVYVPLETPLLAAARARGLRAVEGLGMLLHQATLGFERWFGVRPKVTPELRAAVLADLAKGGQ